MVNEHEEMGVIVVDNITEEDIENSDLYFNLDVAEFSRETQEYLQILRSFDAKDYEGEKFTKATIEYVDNLETFDDYARFREALLIFLHEHGGIYAGIDEVFDVIRETVPDDYKFISYADGTTFLKVPPKAESESIN